MVSRPGLERLAIILERSRTRHIKNTRVVCGTPETLPALTLIRMGLLKVVFFWGEGSVTTPSPSYFN